MSVTVDGERFSDPQVQCVGQVLDRLTGEQRMVTSLLIDGGEPDLDALEQVRATALAGRVVYIETASPGVVANDVLEQTILRLDEAEREAAAAADLDQQPDATPGVARLSHAFARWSEAQEAITQVLALFNLDPAAFELPDTMHELSAHLREMKQAVEREDYVTLADVLNYDLPDTLGNWRGSVEQLRGTVA
ncbi:MAG: hypothetical protein AAF656_09875, partial [Planctomycetota bacterium]